VVSLKLWRQRRLQRQDRAKFHENPAASSKVGYAQTERQADRQHDDVNCVTFLGESGLLNPTDRCHSFYPLRRLNTDWRDVLQVVQQLSTH
jgi:hypothetical protein